MIEEKSEFDDFIKNSQKIIARNIMSNMRDSKFAKNLDIGLYRFIYQLIIGLIMAVVAALGIYYGIISRLDAQDVKIITNDTAIVEVGDNLEKHLESVKDQPLSDQELQLKVVDMSEDVDSNTNEVHRVANLQIQVVTNQNILVGNDTRQTVAIEEIREDIGKIKGKLDIE